MNQPNKAAQHQKRPTITQLGFDFDDLDNVTVEVELANDCSPEDREDIIREMYAAGYKLRNEGLTSLLFKKENDHQ